MSSNPNTKTALSKFLYANGLSKKEVAVFLGMSPQAVSQMASGKMKIPGRVYNLLVNNNLGWDTALLTHPETDGIEALQEQLRAKDEQISELLHIIDKLTQDKQ